jgi:THUMP domain-containing protein
MTTAICNDLADYQWLTGDEAAALLAELAADPAPLHTAVARLRGQLSATRAHLLLEQVELRSRATEKFTHAARMFFTRTALEQATDEQTAEYKAQRLTERAGLSLSNAPVFADLCCGIGGDLLALAIEQTVIGVDLNPIATHLAAANARAVLNRDVEIRAQDVADFDLTTVTSWHIDPDRRHTGKRTTSIDHCTPDRATLDRLLAQSSNAAIKLAPATDVPPEWKTQCEREWISRDRQCRQQIAWHGSLARYPGAHSATVLSPACGLAPRTITGHPNQPIPITHDPARYIFDVDPAVLAAHLTGALAAEHNLQALSAGPTYLTGNNAITDDAALACFEVQELLPMRTRTLAQHLRSKNVGQLEIKKRGVDIDPESLRRDLKLRGDDAATLLITNIARRPTAILAKRIP